MRQANEASWFDVSDDGGVVRVSTGERLLRYRRRNYRIGSAVCAAAGLALAGFEPWLLALAGAGLVVFFVTPRIVRPAVLAEVDRANDRIVTLQSTAGAGRSVALSDLARIRGAYEVYGWDPRSTIYAVTSGGAEVPLLVFTGTNERLAEDACYVLGRVANRMASYAGPFGEPKGCYDP